MLPDFQCKYAFCLFVFGGGGVLMFWLKEPAFLEKLPGVMQGKAYSQSHIRVKIGVILCWFYKLLNMNEIICIKCVALLYWCRPINTKLVTCHGHLVEFRRSINNDCWYALYDRLSNSLLSLQCSKSLRLFLNFILTHILKSLAIVHLHFDEYEIPYLEKKSFNVIPRLSFKSPG